MSKLKCLSSSSLKILAVLFMLSDHLWARIVTGNDWMTYVGRMAFPLFAFLIVEGFFHTSNFKKYVGRLFVFALISEIPFNYLYMSSPIFPFHQNVMFTLLLGLLAIRSIDLARREPGAKRIIKSIFQVLGCMILSVITFPDYNIQGFLTIVLFYVCRLLPWEKLWQLVGMILIHVILAEGRTIPVNFGSFTYEFATQGFAILSLIFIWMYNGRKGIDSKAFQYAVYAFYPVHMLVLHMVATIL